MTGKKPSVFKQIQRFFRWNRTSYLLMSAFFALIFLIGYVWWPLLEAYIQTYDPNISFWRQFDWLLLGNFLVMSLLVMADSNLQKDLPIALIGLMGGLVIESWGTQTELWVYYTNERPPMWIIPAWPIASLSVNRLYRLSRATFENVPVRVFKILHWILLPGFYGLLLWFVWPTIDKSLTIMALVLCGFLIATPTDPKAIVLTFIAGSGLGYFLELWGTTRLCWIYYTAQHPPFFAVLAHGMAAVAFWRVLELYQLFLPKLMAILNQKSSQPLAGEKTSE
jgi:MFS family permease